MSEKEDVLDEFFIDGKLKVGLRKGKGKLCFYEAMVKKQLPNLRITFSRMDGEYEMFLYNVKRFCKAVKKK